MASSIYGMIYDELKAKIEHLPKEYRRYKKAFDLLDREDIAGLILAGDSKTFWFEFHSLKRPEQEGLTLLREYLEKKGYKYLYENSNN